MISERRAGTTFLPEVTSDANKRLTEAKNTFQYSNERGQNQGLKMEDSGMYSSESKGSG
jgi:hypothetical protein